MNQKKRINTSDYFSRLLFNVQMEASLMRDDQKSMIFVDGLIKLGPKYISSKFRKSKEA